MLKILVASCICLLSIHSLYASESTARFESKNQIQSNVDTKIIAMNRVYNSCFSYTLPNASIRTAALGLDSIYIVPDRSFCKIPNVKGSILYLNFIFIPDIEYPHEFMTEQISCYFYHDIANNIQIYRKDLNFSSGLTAHFSQVSAKIDFEAQGPFIKTNFKELTFLINDYLMTIDNKDKGVAFLINVTPENQFKNYLRKIKKQVYNEIETTIVDPALEIERAYCDRSSQIVFTDSPDLLARYIAYPTDGWMSDMRAGTIGKFLQDSLPLFFELPEELLAQEATLILHGAEFYFYTPAEGKKILNSLNSYIQNGDKNSAKKIAIANSMYLPISNELTELYKAQKEQNKQTGK